MKKLLLLILFFSPLSSAFGQTYIPMPGDSATWRYRIYDIDYITQVFDIMVFQNGEDTTINGKTYHKLFSRLNKQVGPYGFNPPIVPVTAIQPDLYYGAIRENGKRVYTLTSTNEQLIYDFNAVVGDSIPSSQDKVWVTKIDSVLLNGTYHRRYLTNDSSYYVIEGIGSSQGLVPYLFDNGGAMFFYCFMHDAVTFSPDTTTPCTYVYPWNYDLNIPGATQGNQPCVLKVFPVPAGDILHVLSDAGNMQVTISDQLGRMIWSGTMHQDLNIPVSTFPNGVYYMQCADGISGISTRKIVIQH